MNLQAWIGQASFNCGINLDFVWVDCSHKNCNKRHRVRRDVAHGKCYCSLACFASS